MVHTINNVGRIYIQLIFNCSHIYKLTAVYNVNGKANLCIEFKKLILLDICFIFLISNCLDLFQSI